MDAIVVAVASLLGVVAGGVITYLINKQALDREDARQRKIVELDRFEKIHKGLGALDEYHRAALSELLKRFGINQPMDMKMLKKNPLPEITFLVEAFMPEVENQLRELRDAQRKLGELLGEAISKDLSPDARTELMGNTFEIEKALSSPLDLIRKDLHQAVRRTHKS